MFSQLTVYSLSKQSTLHSNLIWERVIELFILLSFPLCPRGAIQREKRSGISVSFQSLWNVDRLLLSRCPRPVHVMAADIIYQFINIKHNPEGIRCWCQVSPQHLKFWSIIYLAVELTIRSPFLLHAFVRFDAQNVHLPVLRSIFGHPLYKFTKLLNIDPETATPI